MSNRHRLFRLAVYGHVSKTSGSGPGSNYLLLEHWLKQGHAIDLYSIEGFVGTQGLEVYPNLAYFATRIPWADKIFSFFHETLPEALGWLPAFLFNMIRHRLYYQKIGKAIIANHKQKPYDALLVLDLTMPFKRVPSLFCINWPQSTPLGELEAIQNQKRPLIQLCGPWLYWSLVAWYKFKVASVRSQVRRSDRVVCASTWTAGSWKKLGIDAEAVSFALDMRRFQAVDRSGPKTGPVRFLHLGRIVPRKRLDLLLDAFRLLQAEVPDVQLNIVGRFDYGLGYQALLRPGVIPAGVVYRKSVDRSQVPALFRDADFLIQPSENEDFGSAVMEALACGIPVIVGPTNGTKDYISPSSFVFDQYTPQSVKETMRRAVDAVWTRRCQLSVEARRAAEVNFAVETLSQRLLGIIERARPLEQAHTPETRVDHPLREWGGVFSARTLP
jgi:glycosyltransferase involved in cell wall biosynthesis